MSFLTSSQCLDPRISLDALSDPWKIVLSLDMNTDAAALFKIRLVDHQTGKKFSTISSSGNLTYFACLSIWPLSSLHLPPKFDILQLGWFLYQLYNYNDVYPSKRTVWYKVGLHLFRLFLSRRSFVAMKSLYYAGSSWMTESMNYCRE